MDEKDFNSSVSAEVLAGHIRNIYTRLEAEETPHAVKVGKGRQVKPVTIYCAAKDVTHFKAILSDENKTTI